MNQGDIVAQRQQKQTFLKTEIIEKGYDGAQFGEYLNSVKPGGGGNIDVWSFDELKNLVYKFKSLALQQPDPVADNSGWNNNAQSPTPAFDNPFNETHNMSYSSQSSNVTDSVYHKQRDQQQAAAALPNLRGDRTGHEATKPEQFAYGSFGAWDKPTATTSNTQSAGFGNIPMEESKFVTNVKDDDKRPRIDSQDIRADQEETFSGFLPVKVSETTVLTNDKTAEVHVLGYELVKDGLFSGKHIQYTIKTLPFGWEVKRRYSDFVWLRTTLLKLHPGVMVPPIPKKTKSNKSGFMRRRIYFFQRFLNACMLNDEIRTDKYYFAFLSVNTDNIFKNQKKEAEKKPRVGKLSDVSTVTGQAPLEINKNLKYFAAGFAEMMGAVDPVYEKVLKFSRQLMTDFEQVSNTLYNLADCYASLNNLASTFNKRTEVGKSIQLENIYLTMNNMMATWAEQTISHSENIQKYIEHFYKYTQYENDVFKEVMDFRMKNGLEYIAKKKDLTLKKEKLFAQKDATKWGLSKDVKIDEILQNKQAAFDAMLPKETEAIKEVQTTFAYFNSMCFNQLNQALEERCRQYTKTLTDYGKSQSEVMGQIQSSWAAQLSKVGETKVPLTSAGAEIKTKANTHKAKVDASTVDFEDD